MVLTSTVVMYSCLGKHGIVLNLCFPNGWAVAADEDQLGCTAQKASALGLLNVNEANWLHTLSRPQGLQTRLRPQSELATFHDKCQSSIDALLTLFLYTEATDIHDYLLSKSYRRYIFGAYGNIPTS